MCASPYRPDDLAMARHVVTNAQALTPEMRVEILDLALTILRKDRALRTGQTLGLPAIGPARVLRVPRAVFQQGRFRPRNSEPRPFPPGDAA